jgi:hypothetical protein
MGSIAVAEWSAWQIEAVRLVRTPRARGSFGGLEMTGAASIQDVVRGGTGGD